MLLEVAAGLWNGEAVFRLPSRHGAAPPSPSPHVFALAPLALKQLTPCRRGRAAVISVWQEHFYIFFSFCGTAGDRLLWARMDGCPAAACELRTSADSKFLNLHLWPRCAGLCRRVTLSTLRHCTINQLGNYLLGGGWPATRFPPGPSEMRTNERALA